MGYAEASNLYAYAANDPINALDPSGELSWSDVRDGATGYFEGAGSAAYGAVTGVVDAVVGVGKAAYYATGAALYAATGNQMYRQQSETFHKAVESIR